MKRPEDMTVPELIAYRRAVRSGEISVADRMAARDQARQSTVAATNERLTAAGRPPVVAVGLNFDQLQRDEQGEDQAA